MTEKQEAGADIVERLRDDFLRGEITVWNILPEAADEIERLRTSPAPVTAEAGEMRERIARVIYEVEPHYESGEYIDGFQVSPGGNLSWEQAKDRDAEFGDDKLMNKITEFAYRCADAVAAIRASHAGGARIAELEATLEFYAEPKNYSDSYWKGIWEKARTALTRPAHDRTE
jgi:hypothetical protein